MEVASEAASQSSWMAGSSEARSRVKRRKSLEARMQNQEEIRRLQAGGMTGCEINVEVVQRQTNLVTWVGMLPVLHSLLWVTVHWVSYDSWLGCTSETLGLTGR